MGKEIYNLITITLRYVFLRMALEENFNLRENFYGIQRWKRAYLLTQ
jgi:hypothetical protein